MNVKNVEKENGAAKVTIEIARDEFQTALDKAYAKIRKDIMIPGFRKGKAPRKFVERMYGSQVFEEGPGPAHVRRDVRLAGRL